MIEDSNSHKNVVSNSDPHAARAHFPRGLFQPPGSFRFSADALLLSSFPALDSVSQALDLGAGCGVVGLGMLCRSATINITGLDCVKELSDAASQNARQLGFGNQYSSICADLATENIFDGFYAKLRPASYDLVTANPPYRQRHKGRLPPNPLRLGALFETETTQHDFCRAASLALKSGGRFALIYPAEREQEVSATLTHYGLFPIRILPLQRKASLPPEMLLLECVKAPDPEQPFPWVDRPLSGAGRGFICRREAPLLLHDKNGKPSPEALDFCPFLGLAAV